MRKIGLSAILMILLVAPVVPVAAQGLAPEYVESEPADGATMHQAPAEVIVRFSEPLDESSTMEIRDECGGRVDDGNVVVNLQEMSVGVAEEPSGTYKVNYYAKGIRGLTGQTAGSFTFQVHAGTACDGGDGGHGGHGNGGNGGNNNGGHSGHGGDGSGNMGGHNGHDGGDDGTDHSTMDHTTTSDHTTDHSTMDHSDDGKMDHSAHAKKKGKHAGHKEAKTPKTPKETLPPQAGPDDSLGGNVAGSAVMLSLGLSLVFGVAGGWYLRTTAPR